MHDMADPHDDENPEDWIKVHFYVSEPMALAARELARRHRKRHRIKQYGAGRIVDLAMRRYVAEVMTPQEVAALSSGEGV